MGQIEATSSLCQQNILMKMKGKKEIERRSDNELEEL